MSVFEAIAASITGVNDVFDRAIAVIDDVEARVREADIPTELHTGQADQLAGELFGGEPVTGAHVFDPRAEMLADLARAREMVREADHIAIMTLARVP